MSCMNGEETNGELLQKKK